MNPKGKSDPYFFVKTSGELLNQFKSSTVPHSLNAVWDYELESTSIPLKVERKDGTANSEPEFPVLEFHFLDEDLVIDDPLGYVTVNPWVL